MVEPQKITVALTEQDIVACSYLFTRHLFRKQSFPKFWVGTLVLLGAFAWFSAGPAVFLKYIFIVFSCLAFFAVALLLAYFLLAPREARRQFRQSIILQETYEITFDAEQIVFQNERSNARFGWHEFYQWAESHAYFMLYQNERLYHILPKRAFAEGQIAVLRDHLENSGPKRV